MSSHKVTLQELEVIAGLTELARTEGWTSNDGQLLSPHQAGCTCHGGIWSKERGKLESRRAGMCHQNKNKIMQQTLICKVFLKGRK
jgi:hypothetical protein